MQINSSRGQISKILLILAVLVFIAVLVAYVVFRITTLRNSRNAEPEDSSLPEEVSEKSYETMVGDIRFLFESAQNLGSVLKSNDPRSKDLVTTEKFIKVVIGAQNKGKFDTLEKSWTLGNIIDSEGRNFVPLYDPRYHFLSLPDLCGSILKPEFEPTPCVKIYEVSNVSTNLKVEVVKVVSKKNRESSFIDLDVN